MLNVEELLRTFICEELAKNKVKVYNEFSLQHELGIFLRNHPDTEGFTIEFERNATYFDIDKNKTIKHEIDIVMYNIDQTKKFAIELKFPRNGQYPEAMYSFIKDIKFMEELKQYGFDGTYCLTLVDDDKFYSSKYKKEDIYSYFRNGAKLEKGTEIPKPTGNKDKSITLDNQHDIKWECLGQMRYYIVSI